MTESNDPSSEALISRPIRLIEPHELAEMIKTSPNNVVVVDLRDEDYVEGCIPHSEHYPSDGFEEAVYTLIDSIKAKNPQPSWIVFHCQQSMSRGPKGARLFQKEAKDILPNIRVVVLRGGWNAWADRYWGEEGMIQPILS
ncbi:hypothetical protein BLNAU_17875 [Blattamonas nauphoetae]|uniref:Rhodanese domain-containing protein n=1 Tax=Blattamonas nauphoetae TaxID=2049346 RepID=A0ABQ9XAD4_9EUKA|nr:hypothetical protein BLNAU_17875 [Blattamonas nauphoetae]